jgi:hypothetical protein
MCIQPLGEADEMKLSVLNLNLPSALEIELMFGTIDVRTHYRLVDPFQTETPCFMQPSPLDAIE